MEPPPNAATAIAVLLVEAKDRLHVHNGVDDRFGFENCQEDPRSPTVRP
jgi:hypothetical protein